LRLGRRSSGRGGWGRPLRQPLHGSVHGCDRRL